MAVCYWNCYLCKQLKFYRQMHHNGTRRQFFSRFTVKRLLSNNYGGRDKWPLNLLTPGAFCKKCIFWTFWWFLSWISAKLALIWSKMHLQHDSLSFLPPVSRFSALCVGHAQKSKFWDSFWRRKWPTVPLKCKLTVSTRNSIRVSSFNFRGSRTKFQGSSFETLEEFFEDLEQRFRGNDLILENKTIAMNKAIDAQLYSRKLTRCWKYAKKNFVLCIFYKTHAVRLSTLKLMTAN